jgi:hypothetical protein
MELLFASGEALVMRARNAIADRFLQSDATHLMLIDSDISFNAIDVISLLRIQNGQEGNNEFDVISAPYPVKRVAWDKVSQAAKLDLAGVNAADLQNFATDILLSPVQSGTIDLTRPLEVVQAGTGFMMIRRKTLEMFRSHFPSRRYRSQDSGVERNCSPTITQFFDTSIDGRDLIYEAVYRAARDAPTMMVKDLLGSIPDDNDSPQDYVSEDFMFCRLVREMGLKVWTCPWMTLSHIGSHEFSGRLVDLAQLGPLS